MKNARNSSMKGTVNRKPVMPCRPAFLRRRPGIRLAVVTEVTVASLMSSEPSWEEGPAAAGGPPHSLLSGDRQALLLGVVDDRVLPGLERRRGALALVDR